MNRRDSEEPYIAPDAAAVRRMVLARRNFRSLRAERGIKQADMGFSERQVRRLEQGETIPHSGTLTKLAAAHGMSVEDYLGEIARRKAASDRSPNEP